jgi:signal transduction histidine kinase
MSSANGRGRLEIIDNGTGLPEVIKTTGMGLRIMDFRARMIQASLDIRKRDMGGTIVEILFG